MKWRPTLESWYWAPGSKKRSNDYFGIIPDDSERLVDVFARRSSLAGYFAGHTHRNRVRRFPTVTGDRPWVEVASVKDFPGAWAEYRIYEGGILQIVHRARRPDALAWSERTRGMFGGLYPEYAFGSITDRSAPSPETTRKLNAASLPATRIASSSVVRCRVVSTS